MERQSPKLVLAPLAGFTDAPFRLLCAGFGAAGATTEMASAAAIAHGSAPTMQLLEPLPGEAPLVAQLFGSNADELAFSARIVSSTGRFAAVELNTGCPVPRIRHEGSGAALLRDPAKIGALLAAMKRESGDVPVYLKTRPGPRPDAVLMREIVAAAEEAGVSAITLHARFASQGHGGEVHLDLLAECVGAARVPVTGNGGVKDAATFAAMAETGVAAVMIGRAALDRPEIFSTLSGGGDGLLPPVEIFSRHAALVKEHARRLAAAFPGENVPSPGQYLVSRFKTHLFRYFAGMEGAAALRRDMGGFQTEDDIGRALAALKPGKGRDVS